MRKHDYRRLFCLIVSLFLFSCKLYQSRMKEDQRREQMQSHYKHQVDVVYRELKDSQSRHWLFWTDSSFRFHPDSGLVGQSGQLAMLESKVIASAKNQVSTKSSESSMQTQHKGSTDKRSAWAVPSLWLIGFVLAAVIIVWKFRLFFKTFL